jgi:hypothetical protein
LYVPGADKPGLIKPLDAFMFRPAGLAEKSPRPSPPTCAIANDGISGGNGVKYAAQLIGG